MQEEYLRTRLVGTTFRTPEEAVALANNTRYGLAASIWTENANLALDLAPPDRLRSSVDQFDQPIRCLRRFWREKRKRFRREGGWRVWRAYARPRHSSEETLATIAPKTGSPDPAASEIDRTPKLFIGRQTGPSRQRIFLSGLFRAEARNSGWSVMETARIYAMRWKRLIPRELGRNPPLT